MQLTLDQLTAVCPRLGRAKAARYLPHINRALEEFGITTEKRIECWLAQMAHESIEFTAVVENLNYSANRLRQVFPKYFRSTPRLADEIAHDQRRIGNLVYGSRMGNRVGTDDGYNFRGRTPTHLTGRDNYRRAGQALGLDLVANPDLANSDDVMFRIAGWFWKTNGLNELADRGEFRAITKRINGGYNGLDSRLAYRARAKRAITAPDPDEPLDIETPELAADAVVDNEGSGDVAAPDVPDAVAAAAPAGQPASSTTPQAAVSPVPGGAPTDPTVQVTAGKSSWTAQIIGWISALFAAASGYVERAFGLSPEIQKYLLIGVAVLGAVFLICKAVAAWQVRQIHADPNKVNVS